MSHLLGAQMRHTKKITLTARTRVFAPGRAL